MFNHHAVEQKKHPGRYLNDKNEEVQVPTLSVLLVISKKIFLAIYCFVYVFHLSIHNNVL
jgi:hypothetical protein